MWQATMWEPAREPATRGNVAAEQAQLARLRRQVDERWRTLALAQEHGAMSDAALERLYDAYLRAVDSYVTRQRALNRSYEEQRRAS